ncbi:MAG: hypothetical protein OHK006_15530 [Thermodesulfovibrionales bacterium]
MFNSLILKINRRIARSLPYQGLVIDLGCGTSPYKEDILRSADAYIGVDWPNSQHDQRNVDVFADLTRTLPFPDNYADTVVSFQVMEHLPEPEVFLSECSRILKPSGRLFLTVPFMWHVHEQPHDYFRYTRYGLEYLLRKHGFTDISIKENTGFWQTWVLKLNYHTERFPRPLKYLFLPVWWAGQMVAPVMDKVDAHPEETASYTVTARKP